MGSITYKAEKIGKKDIEFAYYAKCFGRNRNAKRIARSIKRGAKGRYLAREIAESAGQA